MRASMSGRGVVVKNASWALVFAAYAAAPAAAQDVSEPISFSIDEAVAIALERNYRVQRSERSAEIAELQIDSARAGLRPRFDSRIRAGQTQNFSQFSGSAYRFSDLNPDFSTALDATASMPIDLWGVAGRRVEQAELSYDSVALGLAQSTLDVALEIRTLYVRALQAEARLDARRASLSNIEDLLARAREGQPQAVGVLETDRDLALQQLEGDETAHELALAQLAQAMRLPPLAALELESPLPRPLEVPADDLLYLIVGQNRTDLRQAEIALEQAQLRREQARDSRRPTFAVDAFGNIGATGRSPLFGDRDSGRSLGVGLAVRLDVPLLQFDGGVLRNTRRIADIQAEQALSDHAEALERVRNEIDRILISVKRLASRLEALPDTAQAADNLREAERRLLAANAADAPGLMAQVANARDALERARLARTDTLANYDLNIIQLSRAVGKDLHE